MCSDVVISVAGLGKCYHVYQRPSHRLLQGLYGRRRKLFKEFWALRNINLDIRRGETVGIIGKNGSGKSTLLQMIAGTLTPTEGRVVVTGKVAALLELGSGFNVDFTGRENVYLNGAILGLGKADIDRRMPDILAFAEIGEFIDQPIRNYSSGMVVRLAFAVLAHVDADVLIIDEALAVGDAFFTQKCMRFLHEFRSRGTLLFVSHDAGALTALCERALWIDQGAEVMLASARNVAEAYLAQQHVESHGVATHRRSAGSPTIGAPAAGAVQSGEGASEPATIFDSHAAAEPDGALRKNYRVFEFDPANAGAAFGAGGAEIVSVRLLDANGEPLLIVDGGEIVVLELRARAIEALSGVILGFYLKDRFGQRLFGDNTYDSYALSPVDAQPGEALVARFTFRIPVMPSGSYLVDAAIASGTQHAHVQQHWLHDALEIRAVDETMKFGLLGVPMMKIEMHNERVS